MNGADDLHPASELTAIQRCSVGAYNSGSEYNTKPRDQLRLWFGRKQYRTEPVSHADLDTLRELADALQAARPGVEIRKRGSYAVHVDDSGAN